MPAGGSVSLRRQATCGDRGPAGIAARMLAASPAGMPAVLALPRGITVAAAWPAGAWPGRFAGGRLMTEAWSCAGPGQLAGRGRCRWLAEVPGHLGRALPGRRRGTLDSVRIRSDPAGWGLPGQGARAGGLPDSGCGVPELGHWCWPGFLCGSLVFVEEAAEGGPTQDSLLAKVRDRVVRPGRAELAAAMGASSIVVSLILGQDRSSASHLWIIETGLPAGKLTLPLIIAANASPSITEPAPAERTWHRSDYARFSAAIRRSRHPMGGPYSRKAAGRQAKVDELAEAIAAIFKADAAGHRHRQLPCDDISPRHNGHLTLAVSSKSPLG